MYYRRYGLTHKVCFLLLLMSTLTTTLICKASSGDPYPGSTSYGTPQDGSLSEGYLIVTATGFYVYWTSSERYVNGSLRELLEKVGSKWNEDYSAEHGKFGVGRASKESGGEISGASHENGLDLDLRYLRTDNAETGVKITDSQYDRGASKSLIKLFLNHSSVTHVFTSDGTLKNQLNDSRVKNISGHDDHVHVRIRDPDGTGN